MRAVTRFSAGLGTRWESWAAHCCSGWFPHCSPRIFYHRQISGFVFCTFFFFENFLYTATYMADARAEALPLVSLGDSDYIEHDWNTMFGWWGLLLYDTRIAGFVRFLGWMGMISIIGWMGYRYW